MEKISTKSSWLFLNQKSREIFVDLVAYLFVLLFVYTAASKIQTFDRFELILGKSILIGRLNTLVAWSIPILEIGISLLLIFGKTRILGLVISVILLIIFTSYLIYMVNFTVIHTCNCGGVINSLTWGQHIIFNLIFISLGLLAIVFNKSSKL